MAGGMESVRGEAHRLNRLLLIPLSAIDRVVELRYSGKERIGRKTCVSLVNNLHISRDQLHFEVKLDASGKVYVCVHNRGKNGCRVVSMRRNKHARVVSNNNTRLVPDDIIEVLYDHQGRYAFKLIECSSDGGPLVHATQMISSMTDFRQLEMPNGPWLPDPDDVKCPTVATAEYISRTELFVIAVDAQISAAVMSRSRPSLRGLVDGVARYLDSRMVRTDRGFGNMLTLLLAQNVSGLVEQARSSLLTHPQTLALARAMLMYLHTNREELGTDDVPWPAQAMEEPDADARMSHSSAGNEDSKEANVSDAGAVAHHDEYVPRKTPRHAHRPGHALAAAREENGGRAADNERFDEFAADNDDGYGFQQGSSGIKSSAGPSTGACALALPGSLGPRVRQCGGVGEDALEEWDEADMVEDERAAVWLAAEEEVEERGGGGRAGAQAPGLPVLGRKREGGVRVGASSRRAEEGTGYSLTGAGFSVSNGASVVGGWGDVAVSSTSPPLHPSVSFLHMLPPGTLADILSFLPLVDVVRATGVCTEWRAEVGRPGSLSQVDYGALFPGPLPPNPILLDCIARRVRGRELHFANCTWLTTGALLHVLGVPLGAQVVSRVPDVKGATTTSTETQRIAIAKELADRLVQLSPAELEAELGRPVAGVEQPLCTHTYLRHFLGELSEHAVRGLDTDRSLTADSLERAQSMREGGYGESLVARSVSAVTLSVHGIGASSGLPPSPSPASLHTNERGGGSMSMLLDDAVSSGVDSRSATQGAPPLSSLPWWSLLRPGISAVSGDPTRPGWLSVKDLALAVVGAEVLRQRMVLQHDDVQRTTLPGSLTLYNLQPEIAGPAYAEMALALQALRHRAEQARAQSWPNGAGGDGTDSVGGSSATPSPAQRPPLLLSGANMVNTPGLVGAAAQFAQLAEMRSTIQGEFESSLALDLEVQHGRAEGKRRFQAATCTSPAWDMSIPSSDREIHSVVLCTPTNIHAMAVAYTVAAADLFEFEVNLNAARAAAEARTRADAKVACACPVTPSGQGAWHTDSELDMAGGGESQGSAASTLKALLPGSQAALANGQAQASSPSQAGRTTPAGAFSHMQLEAPRSPSIREVLHRHVISWEIPAPVHRSRADGGGGSNSCCPPRPSDEEAGAGAGAVPRMAQANFLGPPLPLTFTSAVTGLDLASCQRLSPSNFALMLSFCPHLAMLRLAGCHQLVSGVLAQAFIHVPKLRVLDLEYMHAVNNAVLASLGRHCPSLARLHLGGCSEVTDSGIGPQGLLGPGCTKLRFLNLRGCRNLTDKSLEHIARLAPGMRDLCITGIPQLTPNGLAQFLYSARTQGRLTRFKAELWSEMGPRGSEGAYNVEVPPDTAGNKRHYRLMGSVVGAVRYLTAVLPADEPLQAALRSVYGDDLGPAGGFESSFDAASARQAWGGTPMAALGAME